jgi:hypothetical protein
MELDLPGLFRKRQWNDPLQEMLHWWLAATNVGWHTRSA